MSFSLWSEWKREMWILVRLAIPAIVAQSTILLMNITDSIFVGHLGDNELAASALGSSWSWSIIFMGTGLSFGLDTLVSQAFGAKNLKLVGIFFQTSVIISTLFVIPLSIVLWYTEPILLALGQEPTVAHMSSQYVIYLIPGVWPLCVYNCMSRYLQNQQIMTPGSVVGMVCVVLNIPFNFVFIFGVGSWPGLGLEGAAIATSISRWLMPIMLWIWIIVRGLHKETSPRFYRESIYWVYIWKFLRYSVPAMGMVVFEAIGFYAITLLVGLLRQPLAIAAHGIAYLIVEMSFIIPFGWSTALTCHLGNLLGEGSGDRAVRVAIFGVGAMLLEMYIHSAIIWLGRYEIVKAWAADSRLSELGATLLSITSLSVILDGYQFTSGAVLKGIGRQTMGSIFNFITYYVIVLPGGTIVGYVLGKGVTWFWWFLCIGQVFTCTANTIYIMRIDWDREVALCAKRVQYEQISDEKQVDLEVDEDDEAQMAIVEQNN